MDFDYAVIKKFSDICRKAAYPFIAKLNYKSAWYENIFRLHNHHRVTQKRTSYKIIKVFAEDLESTQLWDEYKKYAGLLSTQENSNWRVPLGHKEEDSIRLDIQTKIELFYKKHGVALDSDPLRKHNPNLLVDIKSPTPVPAMTVPEPLSVAAPCKSDHLFQGLSLLKLREGGISQYEYTRFLML